MNLICYVDTFTNLQLIWHLIIPLDLQYLLQIIYKEDCSFHFRDEVDVEALNIPEYHDVIKYPLALCNIEEKLKNGIYRDPWLIVNDFWLMFNNCFLFNRKSTKVYRDCLKVGS